MNDGTSDADHRFAPPIVIASHANGAPPGLARSAMPGAHGFVGLLDHLPGMIYRSRNDGLRTMEVVTAGCRELTGYSVDELLRGEPVHFLDLVHADDRARVRDEEEAALASGLPFRVTYRITTRQGTVKWVANRGGAVRAEGGAVLAIEGFVEDVTDRVLIENEIRRHEAMLGESQRLASVGSWERDMTTGESRWSAELYRLLGMAPGQTPASRELWLSCVHPDDRATVSELLLNLTTRAGSSFEYDCRVVRRDGAVRAFANRGRVVRDATGTAISFVGTAQDVTERRETEERMRLLVDAGGMLGTSLDAETLLDVLAKVGIPRLGDGCRVDVFEHGRVTRRTNTGDMPPAQRALVLEYMARSDPLSPNGVLRQVMDSQSPFLLSEMTPEFLERLALDDPRGAEITRLTPLRSLLMVPLVANGESIGAITFLIVSGERRFGDAERALATALAERAAMAIQNARLYAAVRDREARLRGFLEMPGVFLCYLELDDEREDIVFRSPNEQLAASYGLTQSQMDGLTGRELGGTSKTVQTLLATLRRARETGEPQTLEIMTTKTLSPGWRHARVNPIESVNGRSLFAYIGTDATEYKRMEAQFLQAQKMEAVGRLAGGVAHDFNNLLTVIGGSADFLLMGLPDGKAGHEDAVEIKRAAERAAGLTRQLLAFSRRQIVRPQHVDVNALVRESQKMLRRLIGEDVDLRTTLTPRAPIVRIDPGQLDQALVNLVVNARDAMPTGGILSITTARVRVGGDGDASIAALPDGDYVSLSVSDTGVGMDDSTRERIFEPFFTTKETGKGTGLGLSTVFGIVAQADGQVEVTSAPGAGSTFRVYLPLAHGAHADDGETSHATASAGGTETILLVEDEPRVRRFARRALEERGYTVLEAGSGIEALELADAYTGTIQLILTDVVLPLMTSRELLDEMERRRPGTRVLFTSGYTSDALLQHRVTDAVGALIEKPFTIETLTREVRAALDK